MASSGYTLWNVVAGEQPTASKWNVLGNNDASFNSGVGFNDGAVIGRHLGSDAMGKIYPVGCIYIEMTGTNPSTTFGFGTWSRFAQGQTLFGQSAGDADFGTVGSTGGAKTHWHWQTVGADSGAIYAEVNGNGSGRSRVVSLSRFAITGTSSVNGSREDGTYDGSSIPPYITVYFWRRTA